MQFNKVVIAVDFSSASLAAARWVAMQLAPRAELALVHVVSEPAVPSFVRPHLPSLDEVAAELTPALDGALRGLAGVVGNDRTIVKLLTDTSADTLAMFGREFGADLICLGRRRRRRGAAASAIPRPAAARETRIPVLIVPTARPTLPARVLIAVDDHPGISMDLGAASGIAQRYKAALEVLHVLAPELPKLVSSASPRVAPWWRRFTRMSDRAGQWNCISAGGRSSIAHPRLACVPASADQQRRASHHHARTHRRSRGTDRQVRARRRR